jgi:hypothetical protein
LKVLCPRSIEPGSARFAARLLHLRSSSGVTMVLTFAALAPHLAQAPAEHFQAMELWTPRPLRTWRSCHCRQCQRPVPSPAWGKPAFCGIPLRPHKTAMGWGKSMGGFCRVFPAPSQQDALARAGAMRSVVSRGLGVSTSIARDSPPAIPREPPAPCLRCVYPPDLKGPHLAAIRMALPTAPGRAILGMDLAPPPPLAAWCARED